MIRQTFLSLTLLALLAQPISAAAFEVSGWIPYWQDTLGLKSATKNISDLDIVYPFAFTVKNDGTLSDQADLDESKWRKFFRLADKNNVDVMPTVMWSDGANIHRILSDSKLRAKHIEGIVDMVEDGDFAGVNIDYESKLSETKDYFSQFLEELKDELGDAQLSCTIEARTPPDSRWRNVPAVVEYSNDYEAMAEHCDFVEIMAYDQQRADLKLNDAKKGAPYIPVADTDWVEKVVKLALEDIPAEKIMLGVPTYGRQWKLTVAPEWYKEYKSVGAINLPDAKELAGDYKVKLGRNSAGEASYTFFPKTSVYKILNSLPTPTGTKTGFEAAAKALLFANLAKREVEVNVVWYSDAEAIKDKIELVEKYNLKGIAIFKIDGEEDSKTWKLF